MTATIDPVIDQATRKVNAFNEDEIKRAQAWSEWNNTQALKSRETYVRDQGRQDIVRAMLARGLSPHDVADLTGLTADQVNALA